jgi:hypothetical protein
LKLFGQLPITFGREVLPTEGENEVGVCVLPDVVKGFDDGYVGGTLPLPPLLLSTFTEIRPGIIT